MRFEDITYTQLFPTGVYQNQKLEIKISLDDTDSPIEAFQRAKDMVNEAFQKLNPNLDFSTLPVNGDLAKLTDEGLTKWEKFKPTPPPVIDRKAIERLEILIDDATTTDEVRQYWDEAMKLGLMEYWSIKHQNLKK